jgi:HSP20 family protein
MTMATWDPIRELMTIRRDLDRALSSDSMPSMSSRAGFLPGRSARQYPLVNLYESGDDYQVEALMPGIDTQQIDVTVVGNALTIAGQKPGPMDVQPERVHRSERAAGRFIRSMTLPTEIERDQVSAEYRNGILLLTLPRAESAKPKKVRVMEASGGEGTATMDSGGQQAGATGSAGTPMGSATSSSTESPGGMPREGGPS